MYADWRGRATTIDAMKKDRGLEPPKQERPMAATGSPGCRKEKAASAGLSYPQQSITGGSRP